MSVHTAFPDEAKVRELVEHIRARLAHAQQLKLVGQQAENPQVAQAEEIQRRLAEATLKLNDSSRDFSLQRVSQKLKSIAQKSKVKFDIQSSPQGTSCFLSLDAFYLEICFHDNRLMSSIKLVHNHLGFEEPQVLDHTQQDSTSVVENHLTGLMHVYGQADSPERASSFQVLLATESVLLTLNHHSFTQATSLVDVIMTQPLGHVTPRSGGFPMKLTYFIHPYEALHTSLSGHVISHDQEVGVSAKVLVKKSVKTFLLSRDPHLFTLKAKGFSPVTKANGVHLPLTFVLQHSVPIPVCAATMEQIRKMVDIDQLTNFTGPHINQIIAQTHSQKVGGDQCGDLRVVGLPGQFHCYKLPPELSSHTPLLSVGIAERGAELVEVIFLHPGSVIPIVKVLRRQLIYNCLFTSCLSNGSAAMPIGHTHSQDYVFDISTKPPDQITVAMDTTNKPEDKIVFDFKIGDHLRVDIKLGFSKHQVSKELSTILTRCLSIPVTLHAALKRPETLLGHKIATLIKAYHRDLGQLTATISGVN